LGEKVVEDIRVAQLSVIL